MNRVLLLAAALGLSLLAPGVARADENLKHIQQSLRDQGFYYGSIDGAPGDETTQAIRRYQIRNGLQVNGQLNDETKAAILRSGGVAAGPGDPVSVSPSGAVRPRSTPSVTVQPTPRPAATPNVSVASRPVTSNVAPVPPRRTPGMEADPNNDQGGYRRGDAPQPTTPQYRSLPPRPAPPSGNGDDAAGVTPPRSAERAPQPDAVPVARALPPKAVEPSPRLAAIFSGTPYEFAPPPVQTNIVRRVQNKLLRQGFYDQEPDGRLNPLTIEALTNFQGFNRLRRSGRLDNPTLAALRLLPGNIRGNFPDGQGEDEPRRGPGGVFEGRLIQ